MTDSITEISSEDSVNTEQIDVFELSDDEFTKLPLPESVSQEEMVIDEASTDESDHNKETAIQTEETIKADSETESEESGESENNDQGHTHVDTFSDDANGNSGSTSEEKKEEKGTNDVPLVDYKTEYEKLMAPFKANGSNMQVKNVDDAIQLMQMGAGFHKKMAALKPNLRQMKLLEKHNLLDDDKLNFLIDLYNKNPEAIQKLLKDSNIDPLDIDVKAEINYKPTDRRVSDKELALDDVLNNIRETPTFQKTLNVISREWDESSQNTIANEPQIIATINGHMQDGTFDAVMKRVDYERSLGRLNGVSDFDAYKLMGNTMANEGLLQRVGVPQNVVQQPVNIQPSKAEPSQAEDNRKRKKRAASPIKGQRTTAEPTFNPLEMSDEDFAKIDINKYLK